MLDGKKQLADAKINSLTASRAMDPKFNIIRRKGQDCGAGADDESTKSKLLDDLATCETLLAASKAIEEALVLKLSKSMMVNPEDINTQKPLHSFGVDSLVAVEVRNWIFKELKSGKSSFPFLPSQNRRHCLTQFASQRLQSSISWILSRCPRWCTRLQRGAN